MKRNHNSNESIIIAAYCIFPLFPQGKAVRENVAGGVLIGNRTLVLQDVGRRQAGRTSAWRAGWAPIVEAATTILSRVWPSAQGLSKIVSTFSATCAM